MTAFEPSTGAVEPPRDRDIAIALSTDLDLLIPIPLGWHLIDLVDLDSTDSVAEYWDDVTVPEDDAAFLRARVYDATRTLRSALEPSVMLAAIVLPDDADSPGEIATVAVASVSVLPREVASVREIADRLRADAGDRLRERDYEDRFMLECAEFVPYAAQVSLITTLREFEDVTTLVELAVDGPGGQEIAGLWRRVSEYAHVTRLDAMDAYPRSTS